MNVLQAKLAPLLERFIELSLRERLLVGAGLLGLTWMIWQFTLGATVSEQEVKIIRDVQLLRADLQAAAQEQERLRTTRKADPNEALLAEQKALKALLTELNSSVTGSLSRFVPPERMTQVLQDVLSEHPGLKLKLVQRLPTIALLQEPVPGEQAQQPGPGNLYMHPIRLEFEGRYFDVLAYLRSLEEGDWQFNWRRLDFTTQTYPTGHAVIEIETLSRDKRWLGV
ncbi:MAG: hypothetical protein ACR2PZ_22695 [Pseudomonadales bacterium]